VDDSWPEADRRVHKMVMNIGRRPTFEDAEPELRWGRRGGGVATRVLLLRHLENLLCDGVNLSARLGMRFRLFSEAGDLA
jgi:hypothetical protein